MPEWALAWAGDRALLEPAGLALLIGLGFGVVGLAFLVSAWRQLARAREQRERWVRAGAVVVGHRVRGARGVQYPLVQFTLPDGRRVEAVADIGANWRLYGEGQVVALYYDPGQPQQIQLESSMQDAVPAIHGFLGALAAGVGCLTLLAGLVLAVIGLRV